jgi:transposase
MLSLPPQVRVFLCTQPTDMRKSFDGLSGLVEEVFGAELLSGDLFVFLNRRRDRVKILGWDRDGLMIWYKRLEVGTFQLPPATAAGVELDAAELSMLLAGVDLTSARRRKRYRVPA